MSTLPLRWFAWTWLAWLAFCAALPAQDTASVPPSLAATPTPVPATVLTSASRYHFAATWKLPGDGGWEALAVDPGARRLYLARQDRVQVLTADGGELLGEIKGLDGAQGIVLAPRLGRGFAASANADAVLVFDLKTLAPIGDLLPVGNHPAALVYVPGRDQVFVFNAGSKDATILDARDGKTLGTVALGGEPAAAVAEGGGRVFVNLRDTDEVLAIDAETHRVENRYSLKTGKAPVGLSLDPDGGRLFVGCGNEKLVVMATEDGTIMSTLTVGKGAGTTVFDNRTKLAFTANGTDGTATLADAYRANAKVVETLPTRPGARTLALDPRTHALYLPTADFESTFQPGQPSKIVPGTAVLLRYDYDGPRK